MDLLVVWICYSVLGIVIFVGLFLWAVRTGQFRDQERARHLPLQHPPEHGREGRARNGEGG